MMSKQSVPMSLSLHQRHDNSNVRLAKNLMKSDRCLICGDKARIINYGALSCQSCRTFFRRNGFHVDAVYRCLFNGSCEINKKTRRLCSACRLAKCLLVGMNSYLIRKEDKNRSKYSSTTSANRSKSAVPIQGVTVSHRSKLNTIFDDRSCLSASDCTLLSNIVHAYDTFTDIPQIRHTIEQLSISRSTIDFNMKIVLNILKSLFITMESFISSIPDFQILTLNEQNSLFERNLHGIAGLYSVLLFRDSGIIENTKFLESFTKFYGSDMIVQTKRLNKQLDLDSTTVKIMLIIIAFSSCYLTINVNKNMYKDGLLFGTHRLLGSQNVFVELLWKYMISRYGFYATVYRFTRLITLSLDLIKYSAMNYISNPTHHNLVDDAIMNTKETLMINQQEQTLLWGKNMIYGY